MQLQRRAEFPGGVAKIGDKVNIRTTTLRLPYMVKSNAIHAALAQG